MDKLQTQELKNFCQHSGTDLIGIADLSPLKAALPTLPQNLLEHHTHAVSIAVKLDNAVIDAIIDRPTPEYANLYREVNQKLDGITSDTVEWITGRGFKALAVAASRVMDEERLMGGISHRAAARLAGIGWAGKSLMLINPRFGPRIRLATVLTNMPLSPEGPIPNQCGDCIECIQACPAQAIKNVSTEDYYRDREDAWDSQKCYSRLVSNKARPGIGSRICGVCIKVCPFGVSENFGG